MTRLLVCFSLVCTPYLLFAQEESAGDQLVAVRIALLESNRDLQLKDGANLSAAGLNELMASLRKQNSLEHYQFFNLASLENQEAMLQFGQQEPVVTGRSITSTGRASNNYRQQNTGTIVNVKSRVRDGGQILVELSVTSSRIKKPKQEEATGDSNDVSADVLIPVTETLTCQNTVLLTPGVGTVVVTGGDDNLAKTSRTYIIVTATVK
jgi:hypothetical protein